MASRTGVDQAAVTATREVVRQSGSVTSGWFRCQPGQPGFDGGVVDRPIMVFPRTAVGIRHPHRPEVIADPTVAMFYNPGDCYRRRSIDPAGDRCEWLSLPDTWWKEVCTAVDPAGRATDPRLDGAVFRHDHGPAPTIAYLRQRRVTTAIRRGELSALAVEEAALRVLCDVLAAAAAHEAPAGGSCRPTTRESHRRLVADTLELLATTYTTDAGLEEIATVVGASPYHLCRVFRSHTGHTIHRHRTQLRLRAGLDLLGRGEVTDLAALALDLGFANHSHFSATFRGAFGVTPSQMRTNLTA